MARWSSTTEEAPGHQPAPPLAAVVPAGTGAVALTVMWVSATSDVERIWVLYGLEGPGRALMTACATDPCSFGVPSSRRLRCV